MKIHQNIDKNIIDQISEYVEMKPSDLIIDDLKWKTLIRSVLRGKNVLLKGLSGCGKTKSAKTLGKVLNRPFFSFNMGAMQDARSSLIGNVHYDGGTKFVESDFIKAIKTPNAIILLDELSRCHPDGWNIILSVLDDTQRYIRLDESITKDVIKVADGVTFISTANIGNEYTSTRTMDRALMDRMTQCDIYPLDEKGEFELLKMYYPDLDDKDLRIIARVAADTRKEYLGETGKISNYISTRASLEVAGFLNDGFSLIESFDAGIYSIFSDTGGTESERTYVKQLAQAYFPKEVVDKIIEDDTDSYFTEEDIKAYQGI